MHPHNRVSRTQELQMTSVLDENVFNVAIKGTFDDCQNIMKRMFNDLEFRDHYALGSVNSINWARLLAQIVYYFYAGFRVMDRTGSSQVMFAVPTGNFGDIFAGYMAAKMGLPVSRLVLATNENDILSRFFNTGVYRAGKVVSTISPSMDIQVASNFERYLYYRGGCDADAVKKLLNTIAGSGSLSVRPDSGSDDKLFAAGMADTACTEATIKDFWQKHQYLLDPHTAVGVSVARRYLDRHIPMICLATAHPAKFAEAIRDAIGEDAAHHPDLDKLAGKPVRCEVLPADVVVIRDFIQEKVAVSRETGA
jgi:threonine synthase